MDDDLKRMFEAMTAAADGGGSDEEYDRRMAELHQQYPNQWVLCHEDWDAGGSVLRLDTRGPFRTQAEAVECWEALTPDERAGYTLDFLDVPPAGHVRIGSPVVGFAPVAVLQSAEV